MQRFEINIKYTLDFLAGLMSLILFIPLFTILAILIKLDSRGPVFFKQERVGQHGKLFVIYKFRSMVNKAPEMDLGLRLAQDDARITPIGNFLRRYSLDELPQLYNIIKGEMSFIGPRPTVPYQVKKYNMFQRKRLLMKPGLSGWAQVNGRNSLSWRERITLDVWYIDNYSLWLDLKILCKTILVIFQRKGLYGREGVNEDF